MKNKWLWLFLVVVIAGIAIFYFGKMRGHHPVATTNSTIGNANSVATPVPPPPSGVTDLQKNDIKSGTGAEAKSGETVTVNYTGWLYDTSKPGNKGEKFDSSLDRGTPFKFRLGAGQVIPGWDQGVAGMKVGGERELVIPSNLGYGANGAGSKIPPNATLVFDVWLLGVNK